MILVSPYDWKGRSIQVARQPLHVVVIDGREVYVGYRAKCERFATLHGPACEAAMGYEGVRTGATAFSPNAINHPETFVRTASAIVSDDHGLPT